MRLALINPCQPYLVEQHTQVPLGLLYLSAVLKRNCPDVQVQLVDASAMSVQEAVEEMGAFDVYGFTATSLDYPVVLDIREELQQRFPDAMHIVGGPHAMGEADVLNHGWHSVFIGEGEKTIIEFVKDWQITGGVKRVYRGDNTVDLRKLPRPDRDAFPWLGGRVLVTEAHKRSINIMASRGCRFNCAFCAGRLIWGARTRWRTPEDVVAEIEECIEKYGVKIFRFSDDNLAANHRWLRKLCALVKPLGITWRSSVRVDCVTHDILKMMYDAGYKEIGFGVESFDPAVLKALNKEITPEQSLQAIHDAHDVGLAVRILMMISTPGESQKTVDLNIAGLEECKGEFVDLALKIYKPLPGTPVWLHPERFGVTIASKDLSKYNFYVYSAEGKLLWSPLEIDGMTAAEQHENIVRMVTYGEGLNL